MKSINAFSVFKSGDAEVTKLYSDNIIYLYSGFDSEEDAKQAVINSRINSKPINNDIEAYQAHCEAEEYVNNGIWIKNSARESIELHTLEKV